MALCLKCGKNVNQLGRECPYCHNPLGFGNVVDDSYKAQKNENDYDAKSNLILYKSLFIPWGINFYLKNKDTSPLKASSALGGVLIGTIFMLVIILFAMIIIMF